MERMFNGHTLDDLEVGAFELHSDRGAGKEIIAEIRRLNAALERANADTNESIRQWGERLTNIQVTTRREVLEEVRQAWDKVMGGTRVYIRPDFDAALRGMEERCNSTAPSGPSSSESSSAQSSAPSWDSPSGSVVYSHPVQQPERTAAPPYVDGAVPLAGDMPDTGAVERPLPTVREMVGIMREPAPRLAMRPIGLKPVSDQDYVLITTGLDHADRLDAHERTLRRLLTKLGLEVSE